MEELKTLNDLKNLYGFHNLKQYSKNLSNNQMINKVVDCGDELAIFSGKLRQEAIKWIKELRNDYSDEPEDGFNATEYGSNMNVVKWIKHFFNIEERELK